MPPGKPLVFAGPTQKYGYVGADDNVKPEVELAHVERVHRTYFAELIAPPVRVSEKDFLTYGASTTPTLAPVDQRGVRASLSSRRHAVYRLAGGPGSRGG